MGFKSKFRQLFGLPPRKKESVHREIDDARNNHFPAQQHGTESESSLPEDRLSIGEEYTRNDDNGLAEEDELLAPLKKVVYSIDVFHDAENCSVRQSTNGSRLYDSVIKSVLAAAIGSNSTGVDIDADCDVYWRFVLPMRDGRKFPTRTLKDLLTRGVIHINPGEKKGAVDIVIKDAMERFRPEHFDDTVLKKQRRIAVLISGDRDFASNVRRLRQSGLKTILIYTPCKTAPSFIDMIPSAMALGTWEELIDEAEMDEADISHLTQRMSFRMKKKSIGSCSSPSVDISRKADAALPHLDLNRSTEFEINVPDFKFECARDLYNYLLTRDSYSLDDTDMKLFWDIHPNHRYEIGKISNFCMSAKAEGAFMWVQDSKSKRPHTLQLTPLHLRKSESALAVKKSSVCSPSKLGKQKKGGKAPVTSPDKQGTGGRSPSQKSKVLRSSSSSDQESCLKNKNFNNNFGENLEDIIQMNIYSTESRALTYPGHYIIKGIAFLTVIFILYVLIALFISCLFLGIPVNYFFNH